MQTFAIFALKDGPNQELAIVYQSDRLLLNVVGAEDYEQVEVLSIGGPMYGATPSSESRSTGWIRAFSGTLG